MCHQIIPQNGQVYEKKCMRTKRWEAKSWFTLLGKSYFFTNLKKNTWKAGQLLVLNELLRWCLTCYVTLWPEHRCLAKGDEKTKELLSCKEKVSIFFEAPGDIQLPNASKIWGSFPDLMFVEKNMKIALSHVFEQQKNLKQTILSEAGEAN